MSQLAALAALDAELHDAFAAEGMADVGMYTPPEPSPVPDGWVPPAAVEVRVYVDRYSARVGRASALGTEIGILRSDITPRRGGVIAVEGDGAYRLESVVRDDGSLAYWIVERVSGGPA